MNYEKSLLKLVERIEEVIPANPHVLKISNPFDLFKVEGFKCDDIQPSLTQAFAALAVVKRRHAVQRKEP